MKKLYGLIGYPLSHSFSQKYFRDKFVREGIADAVFENFELPSIHDLSEILEKNKGELRGFAITIPYKQAIIPFLTENKIPSGLGACNCVKIEGDSLIGYNTDYWGFKKSFEELLQTHHTKALVLGNGGAAKAVHYGLQELGIAYKIVSRTAAENQFTYTDLNESVMEEFAVIINTTPLGTYPKVDECPSIPYELLTEQHYCFDLVYNPAETLFLQKAKQQGASKKNGMDMLAIQAEANWEIWNQ